MSQNEKDDLLAEARRKYPKECSVKMPGGYNEYYLEDDLYWQGDGFISYPSFPIIYDHKKGWQKIQIVSMPKSKEVTNYPIY